MLNFKITINGGEPVAVKATSRDIVLWEKTTKGVSFSQLSEGLAMTHLYKIAHFACVREQVFTGTLSEFEAAADLELGGEDDEPDPTRPGR